MTRRTTILMWILFWVLIFSAAVSQAQEDYDWRIQHICDLPNDDPSDLSCIGPRWVLIYEYLIDGEWQRIAMASHTFYERRACMSLGKELMRMEPEEHAKIECIPDRKITTRGKKDG